MVNEWEPTTEGCPTMTNDQWHIGRGQQQFGPFSMDEMSEQVGEGRLLPTDLVWCEGMPEWIPAAQVPELFPRSASTPPPLPGSQSHGTPKAADDYMLPLPAFLRTPLVAGFHNQRLLFVVASILTLWSMTLPWATMSAGAMTITINGFRTEYDGWIILGLTIPASVLAFLAPNKTAPLTGNWFIGSGILMVFASVFSLVEILRVWNNEAIDNGFASVAVQSRPGVGLFLAFLVTTVAAVGAWVLVAATERSEGNIPWPPHQ